MGPLTDDTYGELTMDGVLPAGAEVPWVDDDPVRAQLLYDADGVDRYIPLRSGFAGGQSVHFWSFGPAPAATIPVWVFGHLGADESFEGVDHPSLFDAIPGDPGYSPFWEMTLVPLTDAYDGEQITSVDALFDAIAGGLADKPVATGRYVNCPVVPRDAELDQGEGQAASKPATAYYRGQRVAYFTLPPVLAPDAPFDRYPIADLYQLRREGGEPLSEPLRSVDMTGDGDIDDTNDIFGADYGDADYTPLVRPVEVVVPFDYHSIDTTGDERNAEFRAPDDLFSGAGTPVPGHVVAFAPQITLLNLPMQIDDSTPKEER